MLARPVILNVLGTAASLIIGFATSLLVARWLGTSQRGLLGLMQSAGEMAANIAGLGFPFAVVFYSARPGADRRAIFGDGLLFAGVLAAVFCPIGWFFREPIAHALARGAGGHAWVLAAIVVPTTFLYWTTHNQLHGELRFGALNTLLVVSKVVSLVVVIALVGVAHLGVSGALVSVIAASMVAALSTVIVLRGPRPTLDRRLFGGLVRYGVRVQAGTIFQIANYRLDVFVLQIFQPLAAVGYYVVAQIVAELTTVLASAFQTALTPLVSHFGDDEDAPNRTIASLRHHSLLAAVGTILNAGFGTILILFGYGAGFHGALVPMLILLPGIWFLGTGQVVAGDLRGRDRPGLASAAAGVAFVVTIGLDFALIPSFGVTGAALASVASYVAFGTVSVVSLSRVLKVGIRDLIVPTRAELRAYPAALGKLRARLKRRADPPPTAPR